MTDESTTNKISRRIDVIYIAFALITGIAGWVYGIGNRVSVIEAHQQDTAIQLRVIQNQLNVVIQNQQTRQSANGSNGN